jgi:hypothetical protein
MATVIEAAKGAAIAYNEPGYREGAFAGNGV